MVYLVLKLHFNPEYYITIAFFSSNLLMFSTVIDIMNNLEQKRIQSVQSLGLKFKKSNMAAVFSR